MKVSILGAGLSGISAAYFLQENPRIREITLFEKEDRIGGLCRSFDVNGVVHDIGPHIMFSKNQPILDLMVNILGDNKHMLRRSNRIIHKGSLVQYPFENDLSKLPEADRDYCVNEFMNNPYKDYPSDNMLQFFLKTFGEGITNIFLRPYNEKIWKFDPSYMDTQMVERIPKPTDEEIRRSASGETVDGYVHQLHFTYPQDGGIQVLVDAFASKLGDKVKIQTSTEIKGVEKKDGAFEIRTAEGATKSDYVISTVPVNRLTCDLYRPVPEPVREAASQLKYNSIIIAIVNVAVDRSGDNFAFMVADKDIIFHRISKVDFLGANYSLDRSATYMIEITYRNGDFVDRSSDDEILVLIEKGLTKIGFIENSDEVKFHDLKRFEYAYVIYDIEHKRKMSLIKEFYADEGLLLNGRFGTFEYFNMDAVIAQSKDLSAQFATLR